MTRPTSRPEFRRYEALADVGEAILARRWGDSVIVLSVDNPPANAMTLSTRHAFASAWEKLANDPTVRAVVVTGQGANFFSAGLDMEELLSWHHSLGPDERRARIDGLVWDPMSAGLDKPVIGAISGYCLAGGLYLAQMCDIRIAGASSKFGIPEVRWNHPAVFSAMLARMLPLGVVMEMVLWADKLWDADRMCSIGFVNRVVPDSEVLSTALEFARSVAEMPLEAVRAHKRLLYGALFPDMDELRRTAEAAVVHLHAMEDSTEGIRAFVGRRPPEYRGS